MSDKIDITYEATISEIDLGGFGYFIIAIPAKSVTSIFRCRRQGQVELSMDLIWGCKAILAPEEAMRRYREHETQQFGKLVTGAPGIAAVAMLGALINR